MNVSESGYGTKLSYSSDSGTTWTDLAGVDSWSDIIGKSYQEYEATRTDQATRMQDFHPAVYDPGAVGLVLGLNHTALSTLDGFGIDEKDWKVTFASGHTYAFKGWIKEWKLAGSDAKGEHKVNLSIRITSAITHTAP